MWTHGEFFLVFFSSSQISSVEQKAEKNRGREERGGRGEQRLLEEKEFLRSNISMASDIAHVFDYCVHAVSILRQYIAHFSHGTALSWNVFSFFIARRYRSLEASERDAVVSTDVQKQYWHRLERGRKAKEQSVAIFSLPIFGREFAQRI